MVYTAMYKNTNPWTPGEITRRFQDRDNAIRWLKSFSSGKYSEFYINGEKAF